MITDLAYTTENITGNTEVTQGNIEAIEPGIEVTQPEMICAVTKRENEPVTLRETNLEIDLYSTPINMNFFHQEYMLVLQNRLCRGHQRVVIRSLLVLGQKGI